MQREAPEGPNLLATARDALLTEILPKLSGTDAFTARMIANAMAIAAREAAQNDVWVADMRATVQRLTGDAAAPDRAFAAGIRAAASPSCAAALCHQRATGFGKGLNHAG